MVNPSHDIVEDAKHALFLMRNRLVQLERKTHAPNPIGDSMAAVIFDALECLGSRFPEASEPPGFRMPPNAPNYEEAPKAPPPPPDEKQAQILEALPPGTTHVTLDQFGVELWALAEGKIPQIFRENAWYESDIEPFVPIPTSHLTARVLEVVRYCVTKCTSFGVQRFVSELAIQGALGEDVLVFAEGVSTKVMRTHKNGVFYTSTATFSDQGNTLAISMSRDCVNPVDQTSTTFDNDFDGAVQLFLHGARRKETDTSKLVPLPPLT